MKGLRKCYNKVRPKEDQEVPLSTGPWEKQVHTKGEARKEVGPEGIS